jgi:uncharacterized membrane protein
MVVGLTTVLDRRCAVQLDSLLGATLQYSGYCEQKRLIVSTPSASTRKVAGTTGLNLLNNHEVNLLSAAVTSFAIGCIATRIITITNGSGG